MAEDERVIGEWNARANRLISECEQVRAKLAAALPPIQQVAREYKAGANALQLARSHESEGKILFDLSVRLGRRMTIFAQRAEVETHSYIGELDLHEINREIFWLQIAIGAGKLAETGIGILSLFKKFKVFADSMKLVVDGAKTAQGITASVVDVRQSGGRAGPGDFMLALSQLGVYLLRALTNLERGSKLMWDTVGLVRRARSTRDLGAAASTMMQLLKLTTDSFRELLAYADNVFRDVAWPDRAGATPAQGAIESFKKISTGLAAFRDLIDAARAFHAAFTLWREMQANLEFAERHFAASEKYTGSAMAAEAALPSLENVRDSDIETMALSTTNYNGARVLCDTARARSMQIQGDIARAQNLIRYYSGQLRRALAALKPQIDDAEELSTRLRYQSLDMGWVETGGGSRAAAAHSVKSRIQGYKESFDLVLQELRMLGGISGAVAH